MFGGKPYGRGCLTFVHGAEVYKKYIGPFKNGLPNGWGTMKEGSDDYTGEVKNSKKHGFGVQKTGLGKYVGWFKNGERTEEFQD